jgi:hypothetical protein
VERRLRKRDQLFLAIWEKAKEENPKVAKRTIYDRIKKFREKHKIVSKEMAKYAYAVLECNIDVQKFLKEENKLKELQDLINRITQSQQLTKFKRERGIEKKQRLISKKITYTFRLPRNLVNEANRMTEAYQAMYIFENILRHVIMATLEKKYGKDWWNAPNIVSNEIRRMVETRKLEERRNRWHAKRGSHNIFYTDFKDLDRIITTNINDFKDVFGDLEIQAEMRQLERSRNIIAHNNPLPYSEVERVKMYLRDLLKQLGIYIEQQ